MSKIIASRQYYRKTNTAPIRSCSLRTGEITLPKLEGSSSQAVKHPDNKRKAEVEGNSCVSSR